MNSEESARLIGKSKSLLKKRLLEARSVLTAYFRKEFSRFSIDYEKKRMISWSGVYYLQWKVRPNPDKPESYENQQTNRGCVSCEVDEQKWKEFVKSYEANNP